MKNLDRLIANAKKNQRSGGKTPWPLIIIGLIALGAITGYITYSSATGLCLFGNCFNGSNSASNNSSNSNSPGSPIPISFSVLDALHVSSSSNAISSVSTQNIFLPGSQTVFDTSASTSNPISFTQTYSNGENIILQVGKSTYVTTNRQYTISGLPKALTGGLTTFTVGNVYTVLAGTFKLYCAYANGTIFTSAQTYNTTASATNVAAQTITCQIKNSVVNTGWDTTWDPVNQVTNGIVCAWNDSNSAQNVAFNSYTRQVSKGAGTIYPYQVPDGLSGPGFSTTTDPHGNLNTLISGSYGAGDSVGTGSEQGVVGGTNYVQPVPSVAAQGGVASFTIGMTNNVAHGSSEIVGLSCFKNADATVYGSPSPYAQTFGPNAASFGIGFAITFRN